MYFQRWPDGSDLRLFFSFAQELGFDRFELSHNVGAGALAGLDAAEACIVSVHHPCPAPSRSQANWHLTAREAKTRRRAAEELRRTLAVAAKLKAQAVVFHLGPLQDARGGQLQRLRFELESRFLAGQQGQAPFEQARRELLAILLAHEREALERAASALGPVVTEAATLGIRLAIETPYHADQLPSPAGMSWLLEALPEPHLGAWLDTGHVMAKENLGLENFEAWYAAVGSRWLGVHLHDAVGLRDHLIPGMGTVPFGRIALRLPAGVLRTYEVDWYFSAAELLSGVLHLRTAGCL